MAVDNLEQDNLLWLSFFLEQILKQHWLVFILLSFCSCGSSFPHNSRSSKDEPPAVLVGINEEYLLSDVHSKKGWESYPVSYYADPNLGDDMFLLIRSTFRIWNHAVGAEVLKLEDESGPAFEESLETESLAVGDEINSIFKANPWDLLNKSDQVLGTNIWLNDDNSEFEFMNESDILLNFEHHEIADCSDIESMSYESSCTDFVTLLLHEVGHSLGLSHVDPNLEPYSVMIAYMMTGPGIFQHQPTYEDAQRVRLIIGQPLETPEAWESRMSLISDHDMPK